MSPAQVWVSETLYDPSDGRYLGANGTAGVLGEWAQLVFPEPFSPQALTLLSDASNFSIFGSSNEGGDWVLLASATGVSAEPVSLTTELDFPGQAFDAIRRAGDTPGPPTGDTRVNSVL